MRVRWFVRLHAAVLAPGRVWVHRQVERASFMACDAPPDIAVARGYGRPAAARANRWDAPAQGSPAGWTGLRIAATPRQPRSPANEGGIPPPHPQYPQIYVIKARHFMPKIQMRWAIDDITLGKTCWPATPACVAPPVTFQQLLVEGFPYKGGLEGLAAIEQNGRSGPRQLAEVRQGYLQILKMQRRAA